MWNKNVNDDNIVQLRLMMLTALLVFRSYLTQLIPSINSKIVIECWLLFMSEQESFQNLNSVNHVDGEMVVPWPNEISGGYGIWCGFFKFVCEVI